MSSITSPSLSAAFYDANRSGEIVSRLTADTTQIKSTVGATASLALRNTILCIGAGVMMFITSPKLSALVLVAIPVIVFPMVGFGRKVRKRSRLAQDSLAEAMTFAGEAIGATRTVQAFNTEARARTRFSQACGSRILGSTPVHSRPLDSHRLRHCHGVRLRRGRALVWRAIGALG
jgi:ATP-binding cassette subfamily B protein